MSDQLAGDSVSLVIGLCIAFSISLVFVFLLYSHFLKRKRVKLEQQIQNGLVPTKSKIKLPERGLSKPNKSPRIKSDDYHVIEMYTADEAYGGTSLFSQPPIQERSDSSPKMSQKSPIKINERFDSSPKPKHISRFTVHEPNDTDLNKYKFNGLFSSPRFNQILMETPDSDPKSNQSHIEKSLKALKSSEKDQSIKIPSPIKKRLDSVKYYDASRKNSNPKTSSPTKEREYWRTPSLAILPPQHEKPFWRLDTLSETVQKMIFNTTVVSTTKMQIIHGTTQIVDVPYICYAERDYFARFDEDITTFKAQKVIVLEIFSDGYAFVANWDRGESGAVPLSCLAME